MKWWSFVLPARPRAFRARALRSWSLTKKRWQKPRGRRASPSRQGGCSSTCMGRSTTPLTRTWFKLCSAPCKPVITPYGGTTPVWSISAPWRSEEHTSELQSRGHLVCRLLLEKKKKQTNPHVHCNEQFVHIKTPHNTT